MGATHDKNIDDNDSIYSVMIKYAYPSLDIDENDHMQSNQSVSEILTLIRLDNKNYYYYNNLDYTYNFFIIVKPR